MRRNDLHSLSVVPVLLAMLALLQTVGRAVLMSGSDVVSTVSTTVSDVAAAVTVTVAASDCRTVDDDVPTAVA